MLFGITSGLMLVITLLIFAVQAWAFIDAVSHRPDAYVAADKLTKTTWLIILGIALGAHMLIWQPMHFLNLIGTVAALVYVLDVRPALRSLTGRR